MKHFQFVIFIVFSSLNFPAFAQESSGKELVLYNSEEYMPESVLEKFFQATGYRVIQVYYETDELKDELIYATQGKGMDLIIASRFSFNQYADKGNLLAEIPAEKFPNKKHIYE